MYPCIVTALCLLGLPQFLVSPLPQWVFNGSDFILDCIVGGAPPPNITWLLNWVPVDLASGSYEVLGNGSLLVMEARGDTVGFYTCLADNGIGVSKSSVRVEIMTEEMMMMTDGNGEVITMIQSMQGEVRQINLIAAIY